MYDYAIAMNEMKVQFVIFFSNRTDHHPPSSWRNAKAEWSHADVGADDPKELSQMKTLSTRGVRATNVRDLFANAT